ncbi:SMI1/KNR4 family protein [Saccharothrix australiensis]|nr:SMI1/KNR4 family protein [Saccharothrix australiensis]
MSSFVATLLDSGIATADTVRGCTPAEVAEVRADQRVEWLPAQYEEFLLTAGRQAGDLLRGTDFFYPTVLGLADDGRELLDENDAADLLPEGAVVVGMHQGYELYWLAPSGELSWYKEGATTVHRTWPSLLDFLVDQAEAQAVARGGAT